MKKVKFLANGKKMVMRKCDKWFNVLNTYQKFHLTIDIALKQIAELFSGSEDGFAMQFL